jgi:two-component system OmpR family sensor kinase
MKSTQIKAPKSLQKILGIGLTVGVTLLWLLALLSTVYVSHNKLNTLFDSALAETAQRIMPLAVVEITNREEPGQLQQIMSFETHDEPLVYLVRDASGTILLQSHNADPLMFNKTLLKGFSSSENYRFYGAWAVQNTLHIEVAEPLVQRREAIFAMGISLLWPLILLIPLCFIGTWAFVRYSLRHVLVYRKAIESRGSGDLSPIETKDLPTELHTIATSVNDLLARLSRALESERSFTANSAHELRTPIATALAQIQYLQQDVTAGPLKDKVQKVEATIKSLSSLSEKLMQLAKAEGGGLLATEKHDLIRLLKLIVDDSQRSYSADRLQLTLPHDGVFNSAIDPDAFAILVRNLIDNAIKHGNSNQPVEISFSAHGVLTIVNAAEVIPAETLAQLQHRFVRSNTKAQGLGLGLAIANAIVTGVGATMRFNSPAMGRSDGFEVSVDFSLTDE